MLVRQLSLIVCLLTLIVSPSVSLAAPVEGINAAIERGRTLLLTRMQPSFARGETALAALALTKSGAPTEDPKFKAVVDALARVTSGGEYTPDQRGGPDNYEAAVVLMALAAIDANRYRPNIDTVARYLQKKQKPDGAWDYDNGTSGDTSMTQYGILGLWEASNAGIAVPEQVWERTLQWLISRQDPEGGFTYHPATPTGGGKIKQIGVSHTMTVAGVGTMIICRNRLKIRADARTRPKTPLPEESNDSPTEFDLLTLVEPEEPDSSQRKNKNGRRNANSGRAAGLADQVNHAIGLGMDWVDRNFTIEKPSGPTGYYLYGIERLGTLAGTPRLGGVDWFDAGSTFLIKQQGPSGGWTFGYSDTIDTSFAVLFLSRSTLKSIRYELVFLKEGTAVGGRGVPTADEASESITRRNPRYQRALTSAVDEILAALEKGDLVLDEGSAAAIETASPDELIERFGKNKQVLARLAKHTNPEIREATLWAIAKLRDDRLAPILIAALADPDPNVYRAANGGLRLLSRRIGGVGLPNDPPPDQKRNEGIEEWQRWYDERNVVPDPQVEFDDGL